MERMEYDPEGGKYLPVTERETGSTLIVVGVVMLIAGLGWALFVGWDIRAGNIFMRVIFGLDVAVALLLMAVGFRKKNRQKK
jgi:ABC-type sugar transport system permease subunit